MRELRIDIEKYLGERYGNFIILSFEYFKNYKYSRQPFYKCKCTNCNNESILGLWSIRNKSDTFCKDCKGQAKALPDGLAAVNNIYNQYIKQAKRRNYDFNLSKEEFLIIVNKNCYYCDSIPSNKAKNQNNTGFYIYNGIDRVDNTIGYVSNNIVPCCKMCNRCKSNLTLEEWNTWINKLIVKKGL